MGALTPLGKVAQAKRKWLASVTAYTVAGTVASTSVGVALSLLGDMFVPISAANSGLLVAIIIGALAAARELRWISFRLPQLARQTPRTWGMMFPNTVAATIWGLDLGLIFTTWLTYSGAWLLAAVAILVGDPALGAGLFGSYWLGRALSVWVAPLLLPNAGATSLLFASIAGQQRLFQHIHVFGLVWSMMILTAWLVVRTAW